MTTKLYLKRAAGFLGGGLLVAALAWATPSSGFLLNQLVSTGGSDFINQQVQVARDPNSATDEPWQVQIQAQGATDVYVQRLTLAPFGYSGWHTHPGVLVGTVMSGSIDFYDAQCRKTTYTTGQTFQENNQVHGIINNGPQMADLSIFYLVKHGAARRLEASAPVCASSTMIP